MVQASWQGLGVTAWSITSACWVEAAEGYAYTNDDHEAYTEPNDFEAFAADAQGRVLQRVEQVRAILPGNSVSA